VSRHRRAAPAGRTGRLLLIRILVVLTLSLGVNYLVWRWLYSVNWTNWWIAVPLVLAAWATCTVLALGARG